MIPAKRPVVKIEDGPNGTLVVRCKVEGCGYTSDRHGVKTSAEEYARHHRHAHRVAIEQAKS